MVNIHIRPAEETDLPELYVLVKGYLDFYNRPEMPEQQIKDAIIHLIHHPEDGTQLVAEVDGKLIGFTTLNPLWSTTRMQKIGLLNDLFVDPEQRVNGAGKQLMEATIQLAKDKGYPLMRLLTAADNVIAQKLYDKTGGNAPGWKVYDYDLSK
ncbi:N-acetyltransferase family protein [Ornithinibacillus sp. 4-3]|uniref:N-acetyltransferase family protein n=1 Tax=Ornithinibacillus sp. 4-3 TaxID=3231488 RepID=A0AB39HLF9_9BACI